MNAASRVKEILEKTRSPRIVITTHHKPDADALGSSLALYNFFKKLGYFTTVISPTDYPSFLNWMPGEEKVFVYEFHPEKCRDFALNADIIFCLDFNSLKRINEFGNDVRESKAVKVLIDHHLEKEGFEDIDLWDTTASSTAELIYRFIVDFGGKEHVDKDIAGCLYAGIMTDTGSFRFDSVKPNTHRIAAELLETGVEHWKIHNHIFDSFTASRWQFVGYILSNKMEVLEGLNTVIITVTAEELKQYNIKTGDTEGLVNFGLSIKGIELAVLIVDRTVLVKMSFRGKGRFPANKFAREFFEGGGHFSAAGGQSSLSLEETVAKFKNAIVSYKEYLT
ncbi:MAG: bifunctional oligoribonuclease/PAP phosphatase NrnA [Bacteroidetes bacterium]|nr:MAG: bifunctional oligoribonuclease/PAP phosphatase NrnA [Bacteroidota bacterium]